MAGHSKFKNIQFRKGAQDKKRAKLFAKISKEITVAAKLGLPDPSANPRLRSAIALGRSNSVPKDVIDRAIGKATGGDDENYDEIRYEGYGPGGAAVIVDCLTDNKNRTVADVRHAFSKFSGNMGADGSVAYMFKSLGILTYNQDADEDALMEIAIDAGADDLIIEDDGSIEIIVDPNNYEGLIKAMKAADHEPDNKEITWRCSTITNLNEHEASTMIKMTSALEDLDDVQTVYSNAEITDEILAKL